jgi:membrane-associated protease RseP (regulator of RpoE activity)
MDRGFEFTEIEYSEKNQRMGKRIRSLIPFLLFVLTILSTFFVGGGWYSLSIILILLAHEMGHFFVGIHHGVRVSLPFFIPFPFPPFGTMGAIIRMRSFMGNRKALFDIGVAGPIMGLIFAIPAIIIGLKMSKLVPPEIGRQHGQSLGVPILFKIIQAIVLRDIPDHMDIILHPIGYAGWVGLFVTALNLIPVGQLDGGHIMYALLGRKSKYVYRIVVGILAIICVIYNPQWVILVILLIFFGFRHPPTLDDYYPLDWKRKSLGIGMIILFVLSFTPIPFPDYLKEIKRLWGF